MNTSAEYRITAALLASFRPVAFAGHATAIIAGVRLAGWWCWLSLACWGLLVYLAVRVEFDARLFAHFAEDPAGAPAELDLFLGRAAEHRAGRSPADRRRGALRLACLLVLAWLIQLGVLIIAMMVV
jgi:hypothetical protein